MQKVQKYVLFNGIIRLTLEICLESMFSIVITLINIDALDIEEDWSILLMTFIFVILIFMMIIPMPIVLQRNFPKLHKEKFRFHL